MRARQPKKAALKKRAKAKGLSTLERRRVRTAKSVLLVGAFVLLVLSCWRCGESSLAVAWLEGAGELAASDGSASATPQGLPEEADPLGITQEGVALVQTNEAGDILLYQSTWSVPQSQILVERVLILNGWESLSSEQEQLMSFALAPSVTAAGGSLLAAFYNNETGCSILIELL